MPHDARGEGRKTMAAKRTIILGVTGSIAAYKSADMASQLKKLGHDVFCVMTKDAAHFITPLTLQTLSQHPVTIDLFEDGEGDWQPSHLQLADTADLLVISPATANIIAKLAHGIGRRRAQHHRARVASRSEGAGRAGHERQDVAARGDAGECEDPASRAASSSSVLKKACSLAVMKASGGYGTWMRS